MNAGDAKKGQADGYVLADTLDRLTAVRDVNNDSILKLICKKMHGENAEFVEKFKEPFNVCYDAKKVVIDDLKSAVASCKKELGVMKGQFDTTIKQVPHLEDKPFGK